MVSFQPIRMGIVGVKVPSSSWFLVRGSWFLASWPQLMGEPIERFSPSKAREELATRESPVATDLGPGARNEEPRDRNIFSLPLCWEVSEQSRNVPWNQQITASRLYQGFRFDPPSVCCYLQRPSAAKTEQGKRGKTEGKIAETPCPRLPIFPFLLRREGAGNKAGMCPDINGIGYSPLYQGFSVGGEFNLEANPTRLTLLLSR